MADHHGRVFATRYLVRTSCECGSYSLGLDFYGTERHAFASVYCEECGMVGPAENTVELAVRSYRDQRNSDLADDASGDI